MRLLLLVAALCGVLTVSKSSFAPRKVVKGGTLFRHYSALVFGCLFGITAPTIAAAAPDTSLRDQLRVLQVLQVDDQNRKLQAGEEDSKSKKNFEAGEVVLVHGTVSLIPPVGVDTTQYPLGYSRARDLEASLSANKACLILTAVGREGPPLAAKKYNQLDDLEFPLVFDITTKNLIFPYTKEAYLKSKVGEDSLAVTAVLDEDCLLTTNSATSHFGFALSDPKPVTSFKTINREDLLLEDGPISATGLAATPKSDGLLRTQANVAVRLKSDGKQYNDEETDMLSRIDRELSR